MNTAIEQNDQEIFRLKAALYDIDQQRGQVHNLLQARMADRQKLIQNQRQAEADAAAEAKAKADAVAKEKAEKSKKTPATKGDSERSEA